MTDKLRVLYNDGDPLPPWGEDEPADLRKAAELALESSDHVAIIALYRDDKGNRIARTLRMRRGARTSHFELLGAVQAASLDWIEDPL
jgi:hypothetical protein